MTAPNFLKIVTSVINNPTFIELQYNSLKKHMKIPYEFIVFNDAKEWADFSNFEDPNIKSKITNKCLLLGITCINIPNELHKTEKGPAKRCADAMNYLKNYMISRQARYLLLDSDMFLVKDMTECFDLFDAAIVYQKRWKTMIYPWNGIAYFNMYHLKGQDMLDWGCPWNGDVGMNNHRWLKHNYNLYNSKIHPIHHLASCQWDEKQTPPDFNVGLLQFLKNDVRNKDGKFFCELYEGKFLHYRAGGNWMNEGKDVHTKLTKELREVL